MDESTLLLEVGSEALSDLTSAEKAAVLAAYTNAQVVYAGMKVFELLSKKFKPTYRAGKMYRQLSDKYERYVQIYKNYCRNVSAGKLGKDVDADTTYEEVEMDRYKFLKDTHNE